MLPSRFKTQDFKSSSIKTNIRRELPYYRLIKTLLLFHTTTGFLALLRLSAFGVGGISPFSQSCSPFMMRPLRMNRVMSHIDLQRDNTLLNRQRIGISYL